MRQWPWMCRQWEAAVLVLLWGVGVQAFLDFSSFQQQDDDHEVCNDMDERCREWSTRGECEANPVYMLQRCPLSCSACGDARLMGDAGGLADYVGSTVIRGEGQGRGRDHRDAGNHRGIHLTPSHTRIQDFNSKYPWVTRVHIEKAPEEAYDAAPCHYRAPGRDERGASLNGLVNERPGNPVNEANHGRVKRTIKGIFGGGGGRKGRQGGRKGGRGGGKKGRRGGGGGKKGGRGRSRGGGKKKMMVWMPRRQQAQHYGRSFGGGSRFGGSGMMGHKLAKVKKMTAMFQHRPQTRRRTKKARRPQRRKAKRRMQGYRQMLKMKGW